MVGQGTAMPSEGAPGAHSRENGDRVAVLQFANLGTSPDDRYLAEGTTEDLVEKLCQVRQLRVVARNSALAYVKEGKKLTEVAKGLQVGSAVRGSVRREGSKIEVVAQLADGATGEETWSFRREGALGEIFTFQSEMAEGVAGGLKVQLSQSERAALEKKPTASMEAYEAFLRGRSLYREGSEPSLRRALELFEGAVGSDPSFARAHVGVAECHQRLASAGFEPYDVMLPAAMSSLRHALGLDPDLAVAHASLALLHLNEDNAPGVEAEAKTALELNPSLSEAYNMLFDVAGIRGDTEEMVRNIEAAYTLDPLRPLYIEEVGQAYFNTGREQEALRHWRRTEHQSPAGTYRSMTYYYLSKGELKKARKYHEKVKTLTPASPWVTYMGGFIDAAAGERQRALLAIGKLEESKAGPLAFNFIAYVYYALGDLDRYFEYLNRALGEHALIATFALYSPLFAKAREDPRSKELMKNIRRLNGLAM